MSYDASSSIANLGTADGAAGGSDGTSPASTGGPSGLDAAPALGTSAHLQEVLTRIARRCASSEARVARADSRLDRSARRVEASEQALAKSTAALPGGPRAELRASVTAYTRGLRAQGAPPERMLVAVKTAVRDTLQAAPLSVDEDKALTADVVRWSIEAYYDDAR